MHQRLMTRFIAGPSILVCSFAGCPPQAWPLHHVNLLMVLHVSLTSYTPPPLLACLAIFLARRHCATPLSSLCTQSTMDTAGISSISTRPVLHCLSSDLPLPSRVPAHQVSSTPHPLAGAATPSGQTPHATPANGGFGASVRRGTVAIAGIPSTPSGMSTPVHSTPSGRGGFGATPRQTPIRDELGLNDAESLIPASNARAERQRAGLLRGELRAGLAGLPVPQNKYELVAPDGTLLLDDEAEEEMEEDAVDVKARR